MIIFSESNFSNELENKWLKWFQSDLGQFAIDPKCSVKFHERVMCLKTSKSWRQKSLWKTGRVDSLLQDHAEHVTWKWTRFFSIIKIRIAKLLDIDGSSCIGQANHTKGLNFTPSGWKKLTFWSAFSFSSKFLVAVSSFVWVSLNSFSNCPIFFSRASTSSLAF